MGRKKIAPSILSADFANLGADCKAVLEAGADWLHIDVMDGHFVPNITIGPDVVKALKAYSKLEANREAFKDAIFDVHLMIENPDQYIPDFAKAGADIIVVHAETCVHLHRTIGLIHEFGIRAGVSLNPATPLVMLDDIWPDIEMVLIMTVNPGFGGQKHIASARKKISDAKKRIDQLEKDVLIEADGGVGPNNIAEVSNAGCDIFVAGSAIFKSENWADTIRLMKERGGFTD